MKDSDLNFGSVICGIILGISALASLANGSWLSFVLYTICTVAAVAVYVETRGEEEEKPKRFSICPLCGGRKIQYVSDRAMMCPMCNGKGKVPE